jgi:general secretion pathway protein L
MTLVEYRQLSREQQTLSAEIDRIYLQAFPDSRRVVNARVQMERNLTDLRKATAGGNSFFKMLSKVAQSLSETPGVELRHIGYKEGDMEIALVIGDLQQLEQLKQRISDQNRFVVEILSASARDNHVDARLHVKGAGA